MLHQRIEANLYNYRDYTDLVFGVGGHKMLFFRENQTFFFANFTQNQRYNSIAIHHIRLPLVTPGRVQVKTRTGLATVEVNI